MKQAIRNAAVEFFKPAGRLVTRILKTGEVKAYRFYAWLLFFTGLFCTIAGHVFDNTVAMLVGLAVEFLGLVMLSIARILENQQLIFRALDIMFELEKEKMRLGHVLLSPREQKEPPKH